MMVIGITSSGCSLFKEYIFVSGRMPIIKLPDKPLLDPIEQEELKNLKKDTVEKLKNRDNKLKKYARKLKISIEVYNETALEQNKKSGFYDNLDERINNKLKGL